MDVGFFCVYCALLVTNDDMNWSQLLKKFLVLLGTFRSLVTTEMYYFPR